MGEVSNTSIDLVLAVPVDGEDDVEDFQEDECSESNKSVDSEVDVEVVERVFDGDIRLRSKIEELITENSDYKTKLYHLEQIVVPGNAEESRQLLIRIIELEGEISNTKSLYSDIQNQLQVAQESLQSANNINIQLQNQLTSLQAQNEQLDPDVFSIIENFEELKVRFEKQSRQLEELQGASSETESDLRNQLGHSKSSVNAIESEFNKVKVECAKITKEKFEKEADLVANNQEMNFLKSEFQNLPMCNNEVLKRLIGESETEDNLDDSNAATDPIEATRSESHANITTVQTSSSQSTRSASAISSKKIKEDRSERRRLKHQIAKPFSCKFGNCLKSYIYHVSLRLHEKNAHNGVLRRRSNKKLRTHPTGIKKASLFLKTSIGNLRNVLDLNGTA